MIERGKGKGRGREKGGRECEEGRGRVIASTLRD